MTRKRPNITQPKRPPTLRDIATEVGLSTAAVSLVLNQAPGAQAIPSETQQRILAMARKLNYRPNLLARSLRARKSTTLAVMVDDFSGYSAAVMRGVEEHLFDENYAYFFANHHSRPEMLRHYLRFFEDHQAAGFLLISTVLEEAPTLPTVVVSGRPEPADVTHVMVDHDTAAKDALTHLQELGHERIALFKGDPGNVDTEDRWRGIVDAATELGIEIDPARTRQLSRGHPETRLSFEDGYREGYQLARSLVEDGESFSALFAFNDVSAIGAMRAFLDLGLRIPEDVSVIGFDDIESAAFTNPSLTTVRQPLYEMGQIAARRLLSQLENEAEAKVMSVEPELILRGSTGPASQG